MTGVAHVESRKAVTFVESAAVLFPARGHGGTADTDHYWPYFLPGQTLDGNGHVVNLPFHIAYADAHQPVQSTDWWTGVGLQWQGWVDHNAQTARTQVFFNEPFAHDFLDEPNTNATGLPTPIHGLCCWNQRDFRVFQPSNYSLHRFVRGNLAPAASPVVTVGLLDVHPISKDTPTVPGQPPWTNVTIHSHSDWGVVMGYLDRGNELTITMANGSPFTWFERTQGSAPFRVWAGAPIGAIYGELREWYNQDGILGLTVTVSSQEAETFANTAAYVVFSDTGNWDRTNSTKPEAHTALFSNESASRVVVLAMPHNIDPQDDAALIQAMRQLQPYAGRRIIQTRLHYPPVSGSDTAIMADGHSLPLGYDPTHSLLRLVLEATTDVFLTHQTEHVPLQLLFPHHRKAMIEANRVHILQEKGQPAYTWWSIKGELIAWAGDRLVQELPVQGVLPFLPSVGVDSVNHVAGQLPVEDIYATLKNWFYQGEPKPGGKRLTPFVNDLGTYMVYNANSYAPELAGIFETLVIADQLAQSPRLTGFDADLGKPRHAVAEEMRAVILDSLKELVARWGDIYTAGFFIYNPTVNSFLPSRDGYGSVQNLNDKHFHYGYFLRAAAIIGRYDRAWLANHIPLLEELISDVANGDRTSQRYPFLRNLNPFYGHSWANGTGNGGNGNDQESTSEAVNFAAGLLDLGQVLNRSDWRDLGLYLYEQEILAVEQYWFNQDANLDHGLGTTYNGNWPGEFVHYTRNNVPHVTPFIGQVYQSKITRETYFGSADSPSFSNSLLIHAIPLSASGLYMGRNQHWLTKAWNEYQLEYQEDPRPSAYEVIVAGLQAQLPGEESDVSKPGPVAALARIGQDHPIFPPAHNTQGKHWAYTLARLGHLDAAFRADVPGYAVFLRDGVRTYVAYNPADHPVTATFRDASGHVAATLAVPAGAIVAAPEGTSQMVFKPATATPPANRLYLRTTNHTSPDRNFQSASMVLDPQPGDWLPEEGSYPYPGDHERLAPSLVIVPKRPDPGGSADIPPDDEHVRSWAGHFFGRLDADAMTHFALYTNHSLFPGWERDPGGSGDTFTFRVRYDFDRDGEADRVETYLNAPLSVSNTFSYESKPTDYATGMIWPYPDHPMLVVKVDPNANAPFPAEIPASQPAGIALDIWGGSNGDHPQVLHDIPVSVEADPSTGRASWIQPPYAAGSAAEPLICAHVACSDDWQTWLHLSNPGDSAVNPVLEAYSFEGALLETRALPPIPPRGSWHRNLAEELQPGTQAAYPWLWIRAEAALKGMVNFLTTDGQGEALTPLAASLSCSMLFPCIYHSTWPGNLYTGIALANPNDRSATVHLTGYDYQGNPVGPVAELTIPPMGNTARLIDSIFPKPGYDPAAIRSVTAVSNQPLAGLELFGHQQSAAVEGVAMVQQHRHAEGTHSLYFLNVPSRDRFFTDLSFLHTGKEKKDVLAVLVDAGSGNPASTKPWSLVSPYNDYADEIFTLCGAENGFPFEVYGHLSSEMPLSGYELFFPLDTSDDADFEGSLGVGAGSGQLFFPVVVHNGWSAALRLIALGSKANVPFTVQAYSADGTLVDQLTGTLKVGPHNARKMETLDLPAKIPGWEQVTWLVVTVEGLAGGDLSMMSPDLKEFEGYPGLP